MKKNTRKKKKINITIQQILIYNAKNLFQPLKFFFYLLWPSCYIFKLIIIY